VNIIFYIYYSLYSYIHNFIRNNVTVNGSPDSSAFNHDARQRGLKVVGIHPVPLTESRKVHVVVVCSNGVRVYLQVSARL